VKRLVASFVLAARSNNLSKSAARNAAVATARSYREHMRELAGQDVLAIWYSSVTEDDFVAELPANRQGDERRRDLKAIKAASHDVLFSKLTEKDGDSLRIKDQPPLIYHPQPANKSHYKQVLEETFERYRESLQEDRRTLLERYRLPQDFRQRIAAEYVGDAGGGSEKDDAPSRRRALDSELERVKFQHQHGLLGDADLLREVRRIRAAIELLPEAPREQAPLARSVEAAETLEALVGYWREATRQERLEFVRLFVLPEGLFYDLSRQRIVAVQPRPAFLRPLQLALGDWREHNGMLHGPV